MTYQCADCGETYDDLDDDCDCGSSMVLATTADSADTRDGHQLHVFADNSGDEPTIILGEDDTLGDLSDSGAWIAMDATHALELQ